MPAEVAQGTCPTQYFVRGNNIRERQFTFLVNGAPITITAARFAARDKATRNIVVDPIACAFSGNVVTRPAITKDATARWPDGVSWDIEIVTSAGDERTWVRGDFVIKPTDQL